MSRADPVMHHYDGDLVNPLKNHREDCPGCEIERLQREVDRYREALDEAIQFFRNADLGATAIYLEGKRDGAVGGDPE